MWSSVWIVALASLLSAWVLGSCTNATGSGDGDGTGSQRIGHSVTLNIARGGNEQAGAAARFEYELGGQGAFLPPTTSGGVTLGCNNFRRAFSGSGATLTARDSGYVYIHNATGKTMYDTVATIVSVGADTDGVVKVTFGKTTFDYGDIANGGGNPGPDGLALDGDEQEWYYDCDAAKVDEPYLDNLTFTVKVAWMADP